MLMTGETLADGFVPTTLRENAGSAWKTAEKPTPQAGRFAAELGFDSNPRNQLVAEKIQSDLKKVGIDLKLSNLDWKSYLKELTTNPKPVYRFGWLAPFRDPITHLQAFRSDSPNNYTGWKNPAYDRLVDEISALEPGRARSEKIRAAEEILLVKDRVVVPLYFYVQSHAVAKRVSGFRANPIGVTPWDQLRIKEGN